MSRAELVKTLELIKPALATTNMVPIFQCFIFNGDTVAAYDDQIAIVGPSGVGMVCGIHGNTLLGLLCSSSASDVSFQLKNEVVTLGFMNTEALKTTSKLPFQPEENFIFKEPDMTEKWLFSLLFTESLFDAFKMCLETVSVDATQAALLGITLQGDKMYSCNGDALTRIQLRGSVGKNRVLLSSSFCSAVVKLWSTLAVTKGVLQFSDGWVWASFGDWSVYGRILEIQDPIDFEALIKRNLKQKTPTQELPDGFAEALARARVLADPESQKTFASVEKGKLALHTETHMGEIRDVLLLEGHPDVDANVNASHLQRAIQYCDRIAFLDNCTLLEKLPDVLQIVSNMG